MALWCVKGGSQGEREERMLENDVVGIGWEDLGNLKGIKSREELQEKYENTYPDANKHRAGNHVGQLWRFIHEMSKGDLVVVPLKTQSAIAIGRIKSDYIFDTSLGEDMKHQRKVKWKEEELPRTKFDQDLLYSFGAFMTVCQVSRNNAEERVEAILKGKKIPFSSEGDGEADKTSEANLSLLAETQIEKYINRKFKGRKLEPLVEAVLKAKGFFTIQSSRGRDKGVDILAGRGPMGFEEPKVCVQVKSQDAKVGTPTLQQLQGAMEDVKATQGLLVAWGGFKRSVLQVKNDKFFSIRLWDSGDLIREIEKHYDDLPDSIQAELPLERTWILTEIDDEE